MEGYARREHRDDCAEKARVESVHESAHRKRIARQLGDERSIGEGREFGRWKIHDRVKDALLEAQFDVSRTREDEPLEAWRHDRSEG